MKVRVPVAGTVGKSVAFDPNAGTRAEAAVAALAAKISNGSATSNTLHSALRNLQVGDDHPQYTMWQATERIVGQWNFATEPEIEGIPLTEFIEDIVGNDMVQDTASVLWTYIDSAGELEADVNEAWSPTWTANHRWTDNDQIQLGTGGDLLLYHNGTDSFIANQTGKLALSTVDGDINFQPAGTYPTSGDIRYTRNHTGLTRFIILNNSTGGTAGTQLTFNNGSTIGGALAYAGRSYSGAYLPGGPSGAQLVLYTSGDGVNPSNPLVMGTNDVARFTMAANGAFVSFYNIDELDIDGRLEVTETNQIAAFLSGSSSTRGYVSFGTDVQKFLFGAPAGPNELVPGDVAGDMSWSINSGRMMMSFDASTTAGFALGASYMRLLKDNQPLQIGAGQDLELNHDGTNSLITNNTGELRLRAGSTTALAITSAAVLTSASVAQWSGSHRFTGDWLSAGISTAINGMYVGNQQGLHPAELFVNSGGATDAKLWQHFFNTTSGNYRLVDDAFSAAKNYFTITRSGNAVTQMEYGNTTDLPIQIINGQLRLPSVISPAQLTANTNDWAPTGLAGATIIRFSTDASRNITGLTGGVAGRVIALVNVGTQQGNILNEDAASTAANRFALPTGSSIITGGGAAIFWYDGTSSRWRQLTRIS